MTDGRKLDNLLLKILRRHTKVSDSQKLMELESIVYALHEAVNGRDEDSHTNDNWLSIPALLDSILGWFPVEEEHI